MKDEENVSILQKYKRNRAIQAKPFSHYLPLKLFNKETVLTTVTERDALERERLSRKSIGTEKKQTDSRVICLKRKQTMQIRAFLLMKNV